MPRQRPLQARERELLPTRYVHVVFTLPRELAPLALQNKRVIYNLLFHTSCHSAGDRSRSPSRNGQLLFAAIVSWINPDQRTSSRFAGYSEAKIHWKSWLPPRDSNPDMLIQSQLSCR